MSLMMTTKLIDIILNNLSEDFVSIIVKDLAVVFLIKQYVILTVSEQR